MRRLLPVILLVFSAGTTLAQDQLADTTFDGLQRIEGANVGTAYVDPSADFSQFRRVAILDPFVAFRSNWLRDANRGRSRNISSRDMERMKQDMQSLFRTVFTERLEAAGFQIVNTADYDVLVLRPAIIDLDVAAPESRTAARSRVYSVSGGAATLYLQLVDSVSGDVIARAIDRSVVRSPFGQITWTNRVTNTADARRVLGRWADTLVGFLASHYSQPTDPDTDSEAAAEDSADDAE